MSADKTSPASPKRRWLLKASLGVAAAAGLLGGGIWWRRGIDGTTLTADGAMVFRALARGIVGPMLPAAQADRDRLLDHYVTEVQKLVAALPEAKRQQIALLTGLLANTPTRYMVASLGRSWDEASDDDIRAALEHLRSAPLITHRMAFVACRAITCLAFFSIPDNQTLTAYPGPLPL